MKDVFCSERRYLVWDSCASHSQMLLRSPRDPHADSGENIDIIFVAVFYMRIPSLFWGLKLETASAEQAEAIYQEIAWPLDSNHRKVGKKQIFRLTTEERNYFIGASAWRIDKNKLLPRETTLEKYGLPRQDGTAT